VTACVSFVQPTTIVQPAVTQKTMNR